MNLVQIYKENEDIITKATFIAFDIIKKNIEKNENYTLSDEELDELVFDLIIFDLTHWKPSDFHK